MKIALMTLSFILLSGCCSLVWAADEFGPRFGSTAPYALQNNFDRAQKDVEGIGLEDLAEGSNKNVEEIEPAAGEEETTIKKDKHPDPSHPSNVFDEGSEDALYYSEELNALGNGETEQ